MAYIHFLNFYYYIIEENASIFLQIIFISAVMRNSKSFIILMDTKEKNKLPTMLLNSVIDVSKRGSLEGMAEQMTRRQVALTITTTRRRLHPSHAIVWRYLPEEV